MNYLYDGDNLLEEADNSGNVLARYTQGLGIDQPLAELRSGTTSYYEQDGLSSVTSLSSRVPHVSRFLRDVGFDPLFPKLEFSHRIADTRRVLESSRAGRGVDDQDAEPKDAADATEWDQHELQL